jgi:hypothetical protein
LGAVTQGLPLGPSVALREKRLAALLRGRSPDEPSLRAAVLDAQLLGSLELAGFKFSWDEVRGAGGPVPAAVAALRRAQAAVEASPFTVAAVKTWHATAVGDGTWRRDETPPGQDAPAPAPVAFIEGRLAILEQWLGGESGRELKPPAAGALVLARIVEIRPFPDGNGRVSRLAASHVMVRGGMRPPILVGGDRPRLQACLRAAFGLETEPLARLLEEASHRSVDVLIQSLEAGL